MNQHLVSGQGNTPLIKGIACLLSATDSHPLELAARVAKVEPASGTAENMSTTSTLETVVRLAMHIERSRLDRTTLPIYLGREQLMDGASALLGKDPTLESRDALRLLALLLDKLLRGGKGSCQAKLDGLVLSAMEQRSLAACSPNTMAVVRGSWRHKSRNQLGHASWLDVVEAALWCFWHSDDLLGGEALLGVLLGRDERVRLVYGLLAGAFYLN
ncbi:ADP-ribosylglycohydrolase [Aeromonas enteropelogenes]|uniref:ADP-ribosylglycohydrolase n=1 Tax=Aeromonas enteropelogenes TaxID=29489 RepID=UPI003BA26184